MTRGQLLRRSAGGGAVLLAGGVFGPLVDTAAAAPLPAGDTAYVRLLVGAELLAADFYSQAIAASVTGRALTKYLKLAYFNEQQHYESVAGILSGEGVTPAVASDITFTYPDGSFATEKSIVALAKSLEATVLGAYLGAMSSIQTTSLLTGLGSIAANEAQHQSFFTMAGGGKAFSLSFPPPLTISEASNALAVYSK